MDILVTSYGNNFRNSPFNATKGSMTTHKFLPSSRTLYAAMNPYMQRLFSTPDIAAEHTGTWTINIASDMWFPME
jgi:hypothetical protein